MHVALDASVPIPKFANRCGTSDANFAIKRDASEYEFLVWFLDLKFQRVSRFRVNPRSGITRQL